MKLELSMNSNLVTSTVLCFVALACGCVDQTEYIADVAKDKKTLRQPYEEDLREAAQNKIASEQVKDGQQIEDDELVEKGTEDGVEEPVDAPEVQTIDIPKSWTRLNPTHEIWVDMKAKKVIAAGHVVMRAGPLEMFICPRRTKEHESVISVNALSSELHAALLAIGADPGTPVKWEPEYSPASGPIIDMTISWKDGEQLMTRKAQEMVRDFNTSKAIAHDWVFGGSQTYTDPELSLIHI